jgi:hypothetical protein
MPRLNYAKLYTVEHNVKVEKWKLNEAPVQRASIVDNWYAKIRTELCDPCPGRWFTCPASADFMFFWLAIFQRAALYISTPLHAVTKVNPQVNKKLCCYWYEGEISLALEATCMKIPQRWASHWLPCRGGREKARPLFKGNCVRETRRRLESELRRVGALAWTPAPSIHRTCTITIWCIRPLTLLSSVSKNTKAQRTTTGLLQWVIHTIKCHRKPDNMIC